MRTNKILKYFLLITACVACLYTTGQQYTFRRYTPSDGLAGEVVHFIMQDSYGFLWAATGNGLSRFDGKTFRNYAYSEGLRDLAVVTVYEDQRHRLWAGTTKGIAELKNGRFIMHTNKENNNFYVTSFTEDQRNGLLALTSRGAYHFNDTSWVKINLLPEYKESECVEIAEANDGTYYNYEDALLYKKKNLPAVLLAKDSTDKAEYFCGQLRKIGNKTYAAIHNQLFELSEGKMHLLIDSIPVTRFFNFTIDTGNVCWVNIAGKGLYKYRMLPGNKKTISVYEYDSNTNGYPFIDNQRNLWITSYTGLIKVIPKIFEDVTPPAKTGVAKRLNAIPAGDNEIIVSDADGLSLLKKNTIIHLPKPASYTDDASYCQDVVEGFAKDNRDFTWMITRQRKILCWNGRQLFDYSALLTKRSSQYIRNLAVNPVNNMVFICDDSTLICGNENKFGAFTDRNGNRFSRTNTVLFTHDGVGLVNVNQKGIYFITRDNEIIKAPAELDIIEKSGYTYFFEDKEGWIWISNAGKGLVHFYIDKNSYKVKNLTILTTEQGLSANKIADMTFDTEGNKWVSCSNGLAVLKKNAADSSTWDVYTIGKEQNISFAPPLSMTADNAGNVWLASLDKLIRIDSRELILKKIQPGIVIEKVLLDMKETNWKKLDDSVYGYFQLPVFPRLDHSQNTLGIEFSGISVSNADYFEYSYRLEPLDKIWNAPSANSYITLVKLAPGTYTFKVRARGRGTPWSTPALFSFTIKPPFWETWLFRLLIIALAASAIISIYHNRVKKIRKNAELQNQLKELEMKAFKAQMNPHFIYNALNSIQSLIADDRKSEAINYIGTFSRLLRHVLEYTENNVISLEKELQTLKLYIELESLRLNMNLHYTINLEDDIICEHEKLPPLILQPFVENALWHGLSRKEGDKVLTISVSQSDYHLVFSIEDNGIGRMNAGRYKKQLSGDLYSPRGIDITVKRLKTFNKSTESPLVFRDLNDCNGEATGTRVIVHVKRQSR